MHSLVEVQVHSPSNQDYENYLLPLANAVKSLESQLTLLILLNPHGYDEETFQCAKEDLEFPLNYAKDKRNEARSFNRHTGQLYASSGLRSTRKGGPEREQTADPWGLDWSLTTIRKGCSIDSFAIPKSGCNIHVTRYCSIDPDQWYPVFNTGRTVGTTAESISATQAAVKMVELEDEQMAPFVRCHIMMPD